MNSIDSLTLGILRVSSQPRLDATLHLFWVDPLSRPADHTSAKSKVMAFLSARTSAFRNPQAGLKP